MELLDGLSEEEAAACVKTVAEKREARMKWHDPREDEWPLKPKRSPAEVAEFFRKWADEGPTLTEDEWREFARDFDAQRPHRPLFT